MQTPQITLLVLLLAGMQVTPSRITSRWRESDPGRLLFLTPFIEAGNVTGGQAEAVVPPLAGDVQSYAGFLTVNKKYGSNLFFWYFPAEQQPDEAPVVLWLQGGPGSSSLFGLFSENGPYEAVGGKVSLREYSWSKQYNLIYIDNPVGTGYSFTGQQEGYAKNQTRVGRDLYQAVLQFFQLFPRLQGREFFITGESYAGKYIPALGYAIHKANPEASLKINLQGLFIGNGYCDPENMMVYGEYLYQLGLVNARGRQEFKEFEERIVSYIQQKKWMDAYLEQDRMIFGYLNPGSLFRNLTGYNFYHNFLYTEDYVDRTSLEVVQRAEVRRALHVGDSIWHSGMKVKQNLREDQPKSVAPWVAKLLDHYRIMFFNGQLDILVAFPLTDSFLRSLRWSGAENFEKATRRMWKVGDDLAGYAKTAGGLTEVLVRDAGHFVSKDQPVWALDLIGRFVRNVPF